MLALNFRDGVSEFTRAGLACGWPICLSFDEQHQIHISVAGHYENMLFRVPSGVRVRHLGVHGSG